MMRNYDFYTNEQEKKIQREAELLEEAETIVDAYTKDDYKALEIEEAIEEDESGDISYAYVMGENVNDAILNVVNKYWRKTKIDEYIDNADNFKGE